VNTLSRALLGKIGGVSSESILIQIFIAHFL